jgi:hypothetical protein
MLRRVTRGTLDSQHLDQEPSDAREQGRKDYREDRPAIHLSGHHAARIRADTTAIGDQRAGAGLPFGSPLTGEP